MGKTEHLKPHQFKPGNKAAKGRPPVDPVTKEDRQRIKDIATNLQKTYSDVTYDLLHGIGKSAQEILANKENEPMIRVLIASAIVRGTNKGDLKNLELLLNRAMGPVKHKVDITTKDESLNTNNEVVDKIKSEISSLLQAKNEWHSQQTSSEPLSPLSDQSLPSESSVE